MSPESLQSVQLVVDVLNVLVLPALVGVARWLMRVELRLSRIEWAAGANTKDTR
jgi:hypothetical protein